MPWSPLPQVITHLILALVKGLSIKVISSRFRGDKKVEDGLGDLNKPLSNQNLVTRKDTPVYNAPSAGSAPFGVLADNLRYPILHKLKDRLNQTWYQIRIGDRLAYISALDAQPDNGLPVLTYHHILRDEENTRFRHTSTTTSVRAFNNQMALAARQGIHDTEYGAAGRLREE